MSPRQIRTNCKLESGAETLLKRGAIDVMACCTHGVFSGSATQRMQDSVISKFVAMDTVPLASEQLVSKLTVLPVAPLLGEAIKRIHMNRSVSTLFDDWRN